VVTSTQGCGIRCPIREKETKTGHNADSNLKGVRERPKLQNRGKYRDQIVAISVVYTCRKKLDDYFRGQDCLF
jgi:hypothetical protein